MGALPVPDTIKATFRMLFKRTLFYTPGPKGYTDYPALRK